MIEPCLERLRGEGLDLVGPLPADTLFTPKHLEHCDAVLAMYHDQGLPVLKYKGFGAAVNVTLGLPIIRTSVDHGTALDLAGSGRIDSGSLQVALETALPDGGQPLLTAVGHRLALPARRFAVKMAPFRIRASRLGLGPAALEPFPMSELYQHARASASARTSCTMPG